MSSGNVTRAVFGGDEEPLEVLSRYLDLVREKKVQGLALVSLVDDRIDSYFSKEDGTTLTEVLGAVDILAVDIRSRIING